MTNPRVECQFFPPFNRVTGGIGTQPLGQNLCSHALPPSLTQCQAGGRRTRARGTPDCVAHPRIARGLLGGRGSRGGSTAELRTQILGPRMPSGACALVPGRSSRRQGWPVPDPCPTGVTPRGSTPKPPWGQKEPLFRPKDKCVRGRRLRELSKPAGRKCNTQQVSLPETLTVVLAGRVCPPHSCWRKALLDPSFTDEKIEAKRP